MSPHQSADTEWITPLRVLLVAALPLLGLISLIDFWYSFAMNDAVGLEEFGRFVIRLGLATLALVLLFGVALSRAARPEDRRRAALVTAGVMGAAAASVGIVTAVLVLP